MAAIAALTEVAVVEARDETEQSLRGSFLEEVLTRPELEPAEIERRAARLGCDLDAGFVALCADPGAAGRVVASLAAEVPGVLVQPVERARLYALLPGRARAARRVAARAGPPRGAGAVLVPLAAPPRCAGRSRRPSSCSGVTAAGGGPPGDEIGEGTYRLLFRVLASHPQEVRSFFEDTVAPLVATTSSTPPTWSARSTPTSTTTATWTPPRRRSTLTATRWATGWIA